MKLITVKQLQEELQVSRQTIYRFRKEGMPCVVLGPKTVRFILEDVLNWLKNKK